MKFVKLWKYNIYLWIKGNIETLLIKRRQKTNTNKNANEKQNEKRMIVLLMKVPLLKLFY